MKNRDVYTFPKVKPTKKPLASRKLKCGVGINDSDYMPKVKVGGEWIHCPAYRAWSSMITRCYSLNYQLKFPTYSDCEVSTDWLTFSNFRDWWSDQKVSEGKQLDKDIRFKGNKTYSPETCQYVTQEVNSLFTDRKAKRGNYLLGVDLYGKRNRFRARVNHKAKAVLLGYFNKEEEAHEAYKSAKNVVIMEVASRQSKRLKLELLRHTYET